MTVIATDGRTMAGDGQTMAGWTITDTDRIKVSKVDGHLIGATGDAEDCEAFKLWFADQSKDKPKITDDFAALVVTPDERIAWYGKQLVPVYSTEPQAIGCGRDFALAAMDAGLSPTQAVEIACRRSAGCGGTITTIGL